MAYCVFRSDLLTGTDVAANLVSCRVYNNAGKPIAVENGTVVELQGYEEGQREVMKAVLATPASNKARCAIIDSVEVMYDERKRNLDEFINEAGAICRGYIPCSQNKFSVTKEGFVDEEVPDVGDVIGVNNGKFVVVDSDDDTPAVGLGVCLAIEQTRRYTYYVLCVD